MTITDRADEAVTLRAPRVPRREVFTRLCRYAAWGYLAFVCLLFVVIRFAADRSWCGTVLMYGPRWVWTIPLAVLIPVAVIVRRGMWIPVMVSALVMLFGVMRFCVPFHISGDAPEHRRLRIMTCNVDGRHLNTAAFSQVVRDVRPDVVVAQEWSSVHEPAFADGQWQTHRSGELFIASRLPLLSAETLTDPVFMKKNGAFAHYRIASRFGMDLDIYNLHTATPRHGLSAVAESWWHGAATVNANAGERRLQSQIASSVASRAAGSAIVAGDFNMPTDSTIYRQFWSGWLNAFSASGFGFGYSHFTRRTELRIDHILVSPGWRVRRCFVGPDVGSAHRPVIAELEWPETH